jgi:transposase
MKEISVLGIDLAKQVFQLHGVDERGKQQLSKRLRRASLARFIAQLRPCLIGMEACGSAHHWARLFQGYGHEVRLISPQFVKPYVKSQKNDANDAEAICEAVSRPHMRFVPIKTTEQQDMQAEHRVRQLLVKQRTSLVNQLRGLLGEYGIPIPQGIGSVRRRLPEVLEDAENGLSPSVRALFARLQDQIQVLDEQIARSDQAIKQAVQRDERCQRLMSMDGIGPLIATALVAAIGSGQAFNNGRQVAAWLGLVPRQHSSGGRPTLLGISKRGDRYLRTLLIHGARAVIYRVKDATSPRAQWLKQLIERRGVNRATVALANKMARIAWAMLARGEVYRAA